MLYRSCLFLEDQTNTQAGISHDRSHQEERADRNRLRIFSKLNRLWQICLTDDVIGLCTFCWWFVILVSAFRFTCLSLVRKSRPCTRAKSIAGMSNQHFCFLCWLYIWIEGWNAFFSFFKVLWMYTYFLLVLQYAYNLTACFSSTD